MTQLDKDAIIINANERLRPAITLKPKIDVVISKLIGKTVYMQDPRLIRLIVKWKRGKDFNSMVADNYLDDPIKVKEMREVFNAPL